MQEKEKGGRGGEGREGKGRWPRTIDKKGMRSGDVHVPGDVRRER